MTDPIRRVMEVERQKREKQQQKTATWVALSIQVAGIALCVFVAHAFLSYILLKFNTEAGIRTLIFSVLIGIVAWAGILFRTPMCEWWFVVIQPNHGAVMGSLKKDDSVPGNVDKRVIMFEMQSLREVSPGWHGKYPWEVLVDTPINLQSAMLIGNGTSDPLIVYTKDDIGIKAMWQIKLTPLRGYLVNFVRHSDAQIIAFFRGQFESFLIGWFKSNDESDVFETVGHADLLKEAFKKVFGGPEVVDTREEDYGMFTNDPQFTGIDRTESYQKAAEARKSAEKIGESIRPLTKHLPNKERLDPNLALLAGLGVAGKATDIDAIIIPGLSGADAKSVAALAAIRRFRKKGRK